jgi:3-hydroxybutyryl-CoA dehydratase
LLICRILYSDAHIAIFNGRRSDVTRRLGRRDLGFGIGSLTRAATISLGDLAVGQEYTFEIKVEDADIDDFASVSGDRSPLHMDAAFARSRGFRGRVVHGAYLVGLASRMLGMHLPGQNCLLQTVQMKFMAPTYGGTMVRLTGVVDQVSVAARAAVVKLNVADAVSGMLLASGKANIGLTVGEEP